MYKKKKRSIYRLVDESDGFFLFILRIKASTSGGIDEGKQMPNVGRERYMNRTNTV